MRAPPSPPEINRLKYEFRSQKQRDLYYYQRHGAGIDLGNFFATTLFHFSVEREEFQSMFPKLAGAFLTQPEFSEEQIKQEIETLEREYQANLKAGLFNEDDLLLHLLGQPFPDGNAQTLGLENLKQRVAAYWHRHYHLSKMRMILYCHLEFD